MHHLAPRGETRARIYAYIRESILTRGAPPSYREIQAALGIDSLATVSQHLRLLERDGVIRREPGSARGVRLVDAPTATVEAQLAEMLRELQTPAPDLGRLEQLVVEAAEALAHGKPVSLENQQ